MEILGIAPGPKVGYILAALLEEVVENPSRNTRDYLAPRVRELAVLSDKELERLSARAREKKDEFESGIEAEMKKKFFVK